MTTSLIKLTEQRIRSQWNMMALSDYQGDNFTYAEVAQSIRSCHEMFQHYGIKRGDRIALCGDGCARWAIAFLAVTTYGAVSVPILTTFTAKQIQNIVTHSEARMLFASRHILRMLNTEDMPLLEQLFTIDTLRAPTSPSLEPSDIEYKAEASPEDMAMLNYTSGTTGNSKGVILPYRAFVGNYVGFQYEFGRLMKPGTAHVSILPLAHMYGLTLELICPFLSGCHITFLTHTPSPTLLTRALSEIRPRVVMAVPLVIQKLTQKTLNPIIRKTGVEKMTTWPLVGYFFKLYIRHKLIKAFGGRISLIVTGGAGINPTIAHQLLSLRFPLAEAYGATECAPLITLNTDKRHRPLSCGKGVAGMEIRIDSSDPAQIPGEVLTRGTNTMKGYFKNPEATAEVLDQEGWYHTGDNGTIDADGYLYIKGRKKNMLLGSNGQNIYPEEIEDQLNVMLLVQESLVVQRKAGELIALVYPNYKEARELGLTDEQVANIMKLNNIDINDLVPSYERIHHIEVQEHEFEKTAKRTIKRYLYK